MSGRQSTEKYWNENPDRWATMLVIANDVSEMYGLPSVPEDKIRKLGGRDALSFCWWKQANGRSAIGYRWTDPDYRLEFERLNCVSTEDRRACMEGVVGLLYYRMHLSVLEIDCVLGLARSTVHALKKGWDGQSRDFKVMFFGLSGDMRHKGLRNLVLGKTGCQSKS